MSEDQRQKLIEQGRAQLIAAEAEKRMLYDRKIGGASMSRPSVSFIKENVGRQRSQAEINKAAAAHVYPKMKDKAADLWVVKNSAPEKRSVPAHLRDVWKANNTEAQKRTSPEKLREAWNMKIEPSRAQQRGKDRERGGNER